MSCNRQLGLDRPPSRDTCGMAQGSIPSATTLDGRGGGIPTSPGCQDRTRSSLLNLRMGQIPGLPFNCPYHTTHRC
eukprot:scaffold24_cov341-Pavlova_lutheri.AAC.25